VATAKAEVPAVKADMPAPPPGATLPGDTPPKPSFWARLTGGFSRPAAAKPAPAEKAPRGQPAMGPAWVMAGRENGENAFARDMSLPGRPTATDMGVPEGMSNAFTTGVTSRPIPSDFGVGYAQPPGAFEPRVGGPAPIPAIPPEFLRGLSPQMREMMEKDHQMRMAQYMGQGRQQPALQPQVVLQPVPTPAPVSEAVVLRQVAHGLVTQLRDSKLPSERQMAADGLRRVDWKSSPEVVPALLTVAKADPAPMVRVTCIRALGQMKANTTEVVNALQQCKSDPDERVRLEAELTLAVLTPKR
jgi:hypothetical protein